MPTAYPQNVTAVNITADGVILKWDAIDIEDTNGILLGYHVFYKLADLDGPWYNVSGSNLTAQIPVLSLRTYNVNVAGFTAVGDGVWSPPLLINTTGISEYMAWFTLNCVFLRDGSSWSGFYHDSDYYFLLTIMIIIITRY